MDNLQLHKSPRVDDSRGWPYEDYRSLPTHWRWGFAPYWLLVDIEAARKSESNRKSSKRATA